MVIKVKLCYMDTDSFIFHVETNDFYKDIMSDLEKWYDTSKLDKKLNRSIPIRINLGIIGKFKDELKGEVMTEFGALATKLYAVFDNNDKVDKKAKGAKKHVIEKGCTSLQGCDDDHYKDALLSNKTIRTTQQRFKSDHHTITTEEINKIALSRNNDKRIQSFDGIHTYPIGIDKDLLNELETEIRNKPIHLYY